MRHFILIAVIVLSIATMAGAGSVPLGWDTYTNTYCDGFYLYMSPASPVATTVANRVATITPRSVTTYTLTNVAPGPKYFCLTAYYQTQQSICSNELAYTVPVLPPSGLTSTQAVVIANEIMKGAAK